MLDQLVNHFRHCGRCGKSWGSFDWLCPQCEVWWVNKLGLQTRWIHGTIKHHYLMGWHPEDDWAPLVYSLKGGGRKKVFKKMSLFFGANKEKGSLFYPSTGKKDHAWDLASALEEQWLKPAFPLQKLTQKKQALLSRSVRQQAKFLRLPRAYKQAHLIDDIVTTGGTAVGCWRALGQPPKMTVWSLFYRKSL